jgi:hypothetical protein
MSADSPHFAGVVLGAGHTHAGVLVLLSLIGLLLVDQADLSGGCSGSSGTRSSWPRSSLPHDRRAGGDHACDRDAQRQRASDRLADRRQPAAGTRGLRAAARVRVHDALDRRPNWCDGPLARRGARDRLPAATRELFGNPTAVPDSPAWPLAHPVASSLAWCAALLAVAVPLTVQRFRAKTTDSV